MAESRVDDLVKKHEQLNKALNKLSYAEYSEYCTKIGLPLPELEFERVELPPARKPNLVLVSSESDGADQHAELVEFNREETGEENISSTGEFLMHHVRPKWIKSDGQIPEGEEYILEYLINRVVTLQLGYDRSKLASLLEAIVAVNRILEMYEGDPNGSPVEAESDPLNSWVRGDNYDRIIDTTVLVTEKGTEQEQRWTAEAFIVGLRELPGWADWFKEFDSSKEQWVKYVEAFFTNMISMRVSEAIATLFTELGTLIQNPSGIVSLDVYNKRTRIRTTTLRVQGTGRKSHRDPNERDMELTNFVTRTNQLTDLADYIHRFLDDSDNRTRDDWGDILAGYFWFQDTCERYKVDKDLAMSVATITRERWLDKTLSDRRHSLVTMSLTIAREIAARELGLKQKDGSPYDPETLSVMYTDGGGYRGTYRPPVPPP